MEAENKTEHDINPDLELDDEDSDSEERKKAAIDATPLDIIVYQAKPKEPSALAQLFLGVVSADPPTRKMAFLFLLSLIGLTVTLVIAFERYQDHARNNKALLAQIREEKKKQQTLNEGLEYKNRLIDAGSFQIELKPLTTEQTYTTLLNLATVDVILLCDSPATGAFIKSQQPRIRNSLINIFSPMDREELLSIQGKKKLKLLMMRKINEWLPEGKIEEVFFSKLILN
jgi:flagellar basal body-associated protein FliL